MTEKLRYEEHLRWPLHWSSPLTPWMNCLWYKETPPGKKGFLSLIAREGGGGEALPTFLGTFSPTIFLVTNENVLNSELLFRLNIYVALPSSSISANLPWIGKHEWYQSGNFLTSSAGDAVSEIWDIISCCQLVQPNIATFEVPIVLQYEVMQSSPCECRINRRFWQLKKLYNLPELGGGARGR